MIAETPIALIALLAVISIFALVMGYCVALLRTKQRVRHIIDAARDDLVHEKHVAESDLQVARDSIGELRSSLSGQTHKAQSATERQEALDNHAQLQAQRIQTLEAQCAAFEEQQIRLQRDFAAYKNSKNRELEVARHSQQSGQHEGELPMLSRRIDSSMDEDGRTGASSLFTREGIAKSNREKARTGLSMPLSRELDIPSLSESELPDSVDDLEFELVDVDGDGASRRG